MPQKSLYLLRHAKASPGSINSDDHERPLAERGVNESRAVGTFLTQQGFAPECVFCSTAMRTRQTLAGVEKALGRELHAEFTGKLYQTTPEKILLMLAELPDDVSSVLLVGHNPTLHQLASDLAGAGEEHMLSDLRGHFPPGSFVALTFDARSWDELAENACALEQFVVPRQLEAIAV